MYILPSVAIPINPPKASISFATWPLPIPPILGLQERTPTVDNLWVSNNVFAPHLAEAAAASVP